MAAPYVFDLAVTGLRSFIQKWSAVKAG